MLAEMLATTVATRRTGGEGRADRGEWSLGVGWLVHPVRSFALDALCPTGRWRMREVVRATCDEARGDGGETVTSGGDAGDDDGDDDDGDGDGGETRGGDAAVAGGEASGGSGATAGGGDDGEAHT